MTYKNPLFVPKPNVNKPEDEASFLNDDVEIGAARHAATSDFKSNFPPISQQRKLINNN